MLEYIKGKLTGSSPVKAIIDVQGLGYCLWIPLSCYGKLPPIGSEVLLYISTIIREDSHKLFGFFTASERDLFEKLNEISGIGPKTALALIGHMDIDPLHDAILQANLSLICKVPGIGKKTAERLIIEMRDKISSFIRKNEIASSFLEAADLGGIVADAISALEHLGYHSGEAQKAIKKVLAISQEQPKLAELITSALRHL